MNGNNGLVLLNSKALSVTIECMTLVLSSSLKYGTMINYGNFLKIDELSDTPVPVVWKLVLGVSRTNLVWKSVK